MVDVNAAAASGEPVALALEGRITAQTAAPVWRAAIEVLDRNPSARRGRCNAPRVHGFRRRRPDLRSPASRAAFTSQGRDQVARAKPRCARGVLRSEGL